MNKVGRYCLNVLLGIDQLGNTIWGGSPDETISSRIGRLEVKYGGRDKFPWYRSWARFLNWALDKIEHDHCKKAIEYDELGEIRDQSVLDADAATALKQRGSP